MTNRHTRILEALTKKQRIEVATLAVMLEVSQVTIRKDLDQLEERGLIRREHGFASIDPADDVGKRLAYKYHIKRRIAVAAAELVEEGETVLIESGSCCALLAEELATTKRNVTIVTNSAFIANHIRYAPYGKVILLGGYYQPMAQVTVGSITCKCAEVFFSDKFFIGIDGFTEKAGFTGKDHLRAQTVQGLMKQTRQVLVLTDSEKFSHQGVVQLVSPEAVSMVYTDDQIPPEQEAFLQEKHIMVHKVPSAGV
ncbi:MAG: DeoR/GlpR family DNA-binding transcription regulator [Treponema sp.]|jgi:DeoR/GlpR family transcriptional regulator of sugar metabolism|nr:DeoR/GlpR family DNA-binding transcription regulator [Treponema sp.]